MPKQNNNHGTNLNSACGEYNQFAWLYNREWGDFGCHLYNVFYKMSESLIPPQAKILDLCCGSGQLAKVLGQKGYRVTGIDGSSEMLRLAKKKAPQAEFILEDARSFHLPAMFKAVFSTYDSLNHLMSSKEVKAVFRNVYRCLAPGGLFLFDLNTRMTYQTEWNGYQQIVEKPDHIYINRAYFDPRKRIGQTVCVVFNRQGKIWQRAEFRLFQKCYQVNSVESWLQEAGFVQIKKYALNTRKGYHSFKENEDTRVFLVCQKALK